MENFEQEQYNTFFNQIELISKQYDISSTVRNNFNIFSILRQSHDEVNLHSKFIYSALNNLKDHKVVKHFLDTLNLNQYTDFKTVDVYREYNNIDILLKLTFTNDKKLAIIIENKIYAGDQDKQLLRYYEHMKGEGYTTEEIKIYYLSLNAHAPDDKSVATLQGIFNLSYKNDDQDPNKLENVFCLSYKSDIIEWCNLCISEFAQEPTVRETFVQYKLLLEKLTGQLGVDITEKLKELIFKNNKNLENSYNILSTKDEIHTELQHRYLTTLHETIKNHDQNNTDGLLFQDISDEISMDQIRNKEKYYSFRFNVTSSTLPKTTLIARLEFQGDQFCWGFPTNDIKDETMKKNIRDICKVNHFSCNHWWLSLHYIPHRFKDMQGGFAQIINDEILLKDHTNKLMQNMVNNFKIILQNLK